MKLTSKVVLAAAVAVGFVGCAQFAGINTLRGSDTAAADQAPAEAKLYAGKRPGSGQPIARTFKEQPPLIPHAIDNFDEITVADNQCLDCHSREKAAEKKAPKVADSHMAGGAGALRMDRYQCNSCHVPQVDAKPLVQTTFVGTPVPQQR